MYREIATPVTRPPKYLYPSDLSCCGAAVRGVWHQRFPVRPDVPGFAAVRPRLAVRSIQVLQPAELADPLLQSQSAERGDLNRSVKPIGGVAGPEVETAVSLR